MTISGLLHSWKLAGPRVVCQIVRRDCVIRVILFAATTIVLFTFVRANHYLFVSESSKAVTVYFLFGATLSIRHSFVKPSLS